MPSTSNESFMRRNRAAIITVAVLVIGGTALFSLLPGNKSATPKAREFTMVAVALPPPPPPPPPPPREEPPPREDTPAASDDMVIPDPVAIDQPEAPADEVAAEGNESMGTNVQGDGPPDGFGLVGRGSGGMIGGGGGGGRRGGGNSRWDNYSNQATAVIRNALGQHEKTRTATLQLAISIWPDPNGVIERVRLDESSGNAELDAALEREVLSGLQLSGIPPRDMPLPIRIRVTAQRPS